MSKNGSSGVGFITAATTFDRPGTSTRSGRNLHMKVDSDYIQTRWNTHLMDLQQSCQLCHQMGSNSSFE